MTDTARLSRTVLPVHYDLVVETDADATRFSGQVTIALRGHGADVRRSCSTPRTSTSSWSASTQGDRPRRRRSSRPIPATERITVRTERPLAAGPAELPLRFGAPVSRGPARLLPQHLRRRDRRRAGARGDAVRGAARPPGLPVLRRARVQGQLRRHARGRRGAARDLERSRDRAGSRSATAVCACTSRRRSRCRRTSSRGWSARSSSPSRSTRAASRCASRTFRARRTSRASRSTSARSRSRSSPTTTASRTRARSATSSRSPTSRSARWRTSAA